MPIPYTLPDLGYSADALQPFLSAETLEFHHGRHHRGYVDKLNKLAQGTELATADLEETIRRASGPLLNNAAQHFNHAFYWSGLRPSAADGPQGPLAEAIDGRFGSFAAFREEFTRQAVSLFGSGWCWLVRRPGGELAIQALANEGCPVRGGDAPLLTCDVWEHAYYIDYRNERPRYVEAFWEHVDWGFVAGRLEAAAGDGA